MTSDTRHLAPRWMRQVLLAAAIYNLCWGALIGLFPFALFDVADLTRPTYPGIWQCVGMIVGVYGLGYAIAAFDPYRHWPIVLVGFLGKILGPIGFVQALYAGVFNLTFGLTILTNDVIWWVPFGAILWGTFKQHVYLPDAQTQPSLSEFKLPNGEALIEASFQKPKVLILLRHTGCTFTRALLRKLEAWQNTHKSESMAFDMVLVHMGNDEDATTLNRKHAALSAAWLSDPDRRVYQALSVPRDRWTLFLRPKVWLRGIWHGLLKGQGVGRLVGDGFQLGAIFILDKGKTTPLHQSKDVADLPDVETLFRPYLINHHAA